MSRPWIVQQADPAQALALAQALSISKVTASVLVARGLTVLDEVRRWLDPHPSALHDPFLIPDMERAIDRLQQAVQRGERICFYGDYDVDGVSATSLYANFFRSEGAQAAVYIPHRLREGYGLNDTAVRALERQGVAVLVTCDCGTTSHREIGLAGDLGMDVIVTDHHQTNGPLPPAVALLNPHRQDSRYPFAGLCSVGLAHKVVQAYGVKYGGGRRPPEDLDLVALGTVADVVPLQDENRWLVREGLSKLSAGVRCGVRALKQQAAIQHACTSHTVAYKLAPRINAAGRLAHAEAAVRLFTTDCPSEADRIAEQLEGLNRERQRVEDETLREALAGLEPASLPAAIVLHARHWHLGVVGIVAARLVDRFHRPAVVLAGSGDGIAKGSARSVGGYDLHEALRRCRDLLIGFGGHPAAAGLTLNEAEISAFRERFVELAAASLGQETHRPGLRVDAEVTLNEVTYQAVRELARLQPFGPGNPEPTLAGRNLAVLEARVVGENHLRLTVRQRNSAPFIGIGYRMGSLTGQGVTTGSRVDLAFMPGLERWNGLDRVQLQIRDVRAGQGG